MLSNYMFNKKQKPKNIQIYQLQLPFLVAHINIKEIT